MATTEQYWSPSNQQSIRSVQQYEMVGVHALSNPNVLTTRDQMALPIPRKRGRGSMVPPEFREQTRKIKKQNMERRRRACISDKMNALHNLAMNLIGENPKHYQKIEKADLLSMCYTVFENVVTIVNEEPDIRSRVQQLTHEFREKIGTQIIEGLPSENKAKLDHNAASGVKKQKRAGSQKKNNPYTTYLSFETTDDDSSHYAEDSNDVETNKENQEVSSVDRTKCSVLSATDVITQPKKPSRFIEPFSTPIHPKRYILSQWNFDSGYEDSENSFRSTKLSNSSPSKSSISVQNECKLSRCISPSYCSTSSQSVWLNSNNSQPIFHHPFEIPKISPDETSTSPNENVSGKLCSTAAVTSIATMATTTTVTAFVNTENNILPKVWRPYLD